MMHVGIPAVRARLDWSMRLSRRKGGRATWTAESDSTFYIVQFRKGGWTVFDSHGGAWGLYVSAHQAMNAVDLLNQ